VEFCELFEIRDRRTGKIYVIASGHDKFLRNEEDLLQIDGLPFVSFSFTPSARSFWTTPDSFYLLPYQAEHADISRISSLQRRASVLKFLYQEGALDEAEFAKLLSAEPMVGVKVKQGVNFQEAVMPFTAPNNNQQLYNDAEFVRRNARETVGFSRNQLGEYEQTGRRTATEALAVREASSVRMSRRQAAVKDAYVDIITKVNKMVFEFWKGPRWTEVVGVEGAQWIEFSGEELKGDYTYDVQFVPGSTMDQNARKQEALNLYAIMSQDPSVDSTKLRQMLVNAYNDPEFSGLFGGLQNAAVSLPMQEMQQGGRKTAPNKQIQAQNTLPALP
jgi:hypothetical protein